VLACITNAILYCSCVYPISSLLPFLTYLQGLPRSVNVLLQCSRLLTCHRSHGHQLRTFLLLLRFGFQNFLQIKQTHWSYDVPEVMYILIYLLSVVLCLAVGIMLSYHLWGIACGETSVESQDHNIYRRRAKARGEVCSVLRRSDIKLTAL
jgi:hypothetical protein